MSSFKDRINQLFADSVDFVHEHKEGVFLGGALVTIGTMLAPVAAHVVTNGVGAEMTVTSADMIKPLWNVGMGTMVAAGASVPIKSLMDRFKKEDPLKILDAAGEMQNKGQDGAAYLQQKVDKMNLKQIQVMKSVADGAAHLNAREDTKYHTSPEVKEGLKLYENVSFKGPEKTKKFDSPGMGMG